MSQPERMYVCNIFRKLTHITLFLFVYLTEKHTQNSLKLLKTDKKVFFLVKYIIFDCV